MTDAHTHIWPVRVYYEDTDLAGIVYYANYLKFIERARTEYVREMGVDQTRLKSEQGVVFAVRRVEADYLTPAHFDDRLNVETTVVETTPARLVMKQDVKRGDTLCFTAVVTIFALTAEGRPTRLPADIRRHL
ncbi:MAG: tol-pal system-associated acyl-CoA thioesterase [Rhodobacteraceae bacterium]|nr:tol-pal system-associated acyl-CoA thioesterase [Paracoccaceae bacterium]